MFVCLFDAVLLLSLSFFFSYALFTLEEGFV